MPAPLRRHTAPDSRAGIINEPEPDMAGNRANASGGAAMRYSFLLVNYNMAGLVGQCIDGIERQLAGQPEYEILVADNSTDHEFRLPTDYGATHPHVRVAHLEENRGWVHALNFLIPQANGDLAVIMHPDVCMEPGCLSRIHAFMDAHPRAGLVSPNLYYPNGQENAVRLRFPSVAVEIRRTANIVCHILAKRRPLRGELLWDHQADAQADMLMSVCMIIRRQALAEVGAVDPRLWTYYANDYISARAGRLGWTCHYLADARAIHFERFSDQALYSNGVDSEYKRSGVPAAARMERDRFTFLSTLYWAPTVLVFRMLALVEYCIQLLAQVKRPAKQRAREVRHLRAAIGAILGRREVGPLQDAGKAQQAR